MTRSMVEMAVEWIYNKFRNSHKQTSNKISVLAVFEIQISYKIHNRVSENNALNTKRLQIILTFTIPVKDKSMTDFIKPFLSLINRIKVLCTINGFSKKCIPTLTKLNILPTIKSVSFVVE